MSQICDTTCKSYRHPMYVPPNDHDDAEKVDFYQQLQDLVDKIPQHGITIVMSDMNAQIGGDR